MRYLIPLILTLVLQSVRSEVSPKWERTGLEDGVELFKREVPGSDVVALKGKGTIDAPCAKVASILLGMKRAPEWVDSLRESRMVRKIGEFNYIEYNYINTFPIIMLNRDFVSHVTIKTDTDSKTFELDYRPADNAEVAIDGTVRGEIQSGTFHLSCPDPRVTQLVAEIHADPKGGLAKWIVNFFQKDWPKNTFLALRKQAAKTDIETPADFKIAIRSVETFYSSPKKPVLRESE